MFHPDVPTHSVAHSLSTKQEFSLVKKLPKPSLLRKMNNPAGFGRPSLKGLNRVGLLGSLGLLGSFGVDGRFIEERASCKSRPANQLRMRWMEKGGCGIVSMYHTATHSNAYYMITFATESGRILGMISSLNEIDWQLELSQFSTQGHASFSMLQFSSLIRSWDMFAKMGDKWGRRLNPDPAHITIDFHIVLKITSTPTEVRAVVFGLRMSHEVHIQGLPR